MQDKKYDFKCVYFANQIIINLTNEGYFIENLINPETLRYVLYQLVQNNLDSVGKMDISREQMIGALSLAQKDSIENIQNDMIKEGLLDYHHIDENGEYIMSVTDLGKEYYKDSEPIRQKIRKSIEEEKRKGAAT